MPYGVASEFKAEAEAMHGGLVVSGTPGNMMGLLGGSAETATGGGPTTWKEFQVKLRGEGAQLKVPTKQELDTYGARLIPYVAAQDGDAAGVVREYLQDPGCEDLQFEQIELKMGNYESSQLAAAIMGSLDQRMVTYVTEQVGAAAGGLKMLRALYEPYYSIPLEDRMAEEVAMLKSRKVFQAKCDVYEAMEGWLRAYRVVSDPAQRPEEKEMREALMVRCSSLGITTELEVERVMVRAQVLVQALVSELEL